MKSLNIYACASVLALTAGNAVAASYPVTVDDTLELMVFGSILYLPATATGYYDDVTGEGSWTMTVDLTGVGFPPITFDQDWTVDSVSGVGSLLFPYNCVGPTIACAGLSPEFRGPITATPTPIAGGDYDFNVTTPNFGALLIPVSMDTGEPGVRVAIDIATTQFECVNESALVNASANVTLLNDAELASIAWSIDGLPVASTQALTEYVSLGSHSISVVATITTGDQSSAQRTVTVVDSVAPTVSAFFTDSRTGEVITSIASRNTSFVQANISASDACDNNPSSSGFGGFPVNDGDTLKIQGNQDKVELTTSTIQLKAEGSDSSGNSSSAQTSLTILP